MNRDEESQCLYKDGRGAIIRPEYANFSYYQEVTGSWVRSILHGKKNEIIANLSVFPKGYYQGS